MTFISKEPLEMAKINNDKTTPLAGTRALFASQDGWYDKDENGLVDKIATKADVDLAVDECATKSALYYGNSSVTPSPIKDFKYRINNEGTKEAEAVITEYCGVDNLVVIPYEINGVEVTQISNDAFMGNQHIFDVVIPTCVYDVGEGAFFDCENLFSIIGGENVTSIGANAFFLTGLIECDFKKLDSIGACAFAESGLERISIPNKVNKIAEGAFMQCNNLDSISLPNSIRHVGKQAFKNCINLYSVFISQGVEQIEEEAFFGCVSLSKVTIPASVTAIDERAFDGILGNATFYVEQGSYAETYAKTSGFQIRYINICPTTYATKEDVEATDDSVLALSEQVNTNRNDIDGLMSTELVVQGGGNAFYELVGNHQEVRVMRATDVTVYTENAPTSISLSLCTETRINCPFATVDGVPTLTVAATADVRYTATGYISWFSFVAQSVAPTIIVEGDVSFSGVDCDENGAFVPVAGVNYSVQVRNIGSYNEPKLIGNVNRW